MASLSDVFTEKEVTNWLKAWLTIDIAKSGLEQFVENEAKTVHAIMYQSVWSNNQAPAACIGCHTANLLKCPLQGVCNKRGAHSTCTSMHDNAAKQPRPCPANVCNKIHDEIVRQHKFTHPSWKNTMAKQWANSPWQIAKAYLPPDGYAENISVQDTDFNGIISFMINCKHFDTKFSFPISPGKHSPPCLLTKAREIGRTVRHSAQCKVTDLDLQDIFTTLTSLLSDPTCLAHDVTAQSALKKLAELQNDVMKTPAEDFINSLEAAQVKLKTVENIADKTLMEFEKLKKELNAHMEKCIQTLDDHTVKCKHAVYEHVSKAPKSPYEQSCKELIKDMKTLYRDKLNHVTISQLVDNIDEKLRDVYMSPKILAMRKDPGAFKKTDTRVTKYKDMFVTDDKVNRRIFLQGEAGSGKTTFLAKLALDWCEHTSSHKESSNNTDIEKSEFFIHDHTRSSTVCVGSEKSDMSDASFSTFRVSDISRTFDSSAKYSEVSWYYDTIGHANNSSPIFADLNVLQDYIFVFHITLRNSMEEFDVTTMIKEQIINSIYYSHKDREKAYTLVNEIMKRERCLVLLDGLDEWTGPGDHHNLPTLVEDHSQCVILITTRPWKLALGKIRHSGIDKLLQLEGINDPFELSKIILSRLVDKEELETKYSAFILYIEKQKLNKLLSSPMMLFAIVCSYAEGTELKGSKCKIYILLLEGLFKKASREMCEFQQPPFPCFTGTQYIQPHMEHLNRLAEMAFYLLFVNAKENSLVFSIKELKKFEMIEGERKDFALRTGLLSATRNSCKLRSASSFMFIHMSMQQFLAAYHIARNTNLINGYIAVYLNRHKDAYHDISQLFIFLCGLNKTAAEKLASMMDELDALNECDDWDSWNHEVFQGIILAGYREAYANGHTDISLKLSNFYFCEHNLDLYRIWTNNTANALSLKVYMDDRKSFENRPILSTNDESASHMKLDLKSCCKLKQLKLAGRGILLKDSTGVAKSELPVCIVLNSAKPTWFTESPPVLPSIENITLDHVTCSSTWLRELLSMLLTRAHYLQCTLEDCQIISCVAGTSYTACYTLINKVNKELSMFLDDDLWEKLYGLNIKSLSLDGYCKRFRMKHDKFSRTLQSLTQLEKLSIVVDKDNPSLWEALHGLNIKSLSLSSCWGSVSAESLSDSLSSLNQLETLSIIVGKDSPALWDALNSLKIKCLRLSLSEEWGVVQAESTSQSLSSLTQLKTLSIKMQYDSFGLWEALHGLNIKSLSLSGGWGGLRADSLSQSLLSLTQLETLCIEVEYDSPGLWKALWGLKIKSLRLIGKRGGFKVYHEVSFSESLSSLTKLETLSMDVEYDISGLCQVLRGLNIKSLSLDGVFGVFCAEPLSQSLSSLTQLETLSISVRKQSPDLWEALNGVNIKCLSLSLSDEWGGVRTELFSQSLLSLSQLETLSMEVEYDIPGLWEALRGLKIKNLNLRLSVWKGLREKTFSVSLSSLTQLETLSIEVKYDIPGLWESIRGMNIKSLSLRLIDVWKVLPAESFAQSLSSLTQLKKLSIEVEYEIPGLWESLGEGSLSQSLLSLKQLDRLSIVVDKDTPGLWEALDGLNIKILSVCIGCGVFRLKRYNQSLSYLKNLEQLCVVVDEDSHDLWKAVSGLNIKCLSLSLSNQRGSVRAESLSHSLNSLKQLQTLSIKMQYDSPGLWEALRGVNIKSLSLSGEWRGLLAGSLSQSLASLTQLDTLSMKMPYDSPGLWEALHDLNIKSLILSFKWASFKLNYKESFSKSIRSLKQLETLFIEVFDACPVLFEVLLGLNIKSLSLCDVFGVMCAESLSKLLSSLTQLETLDISVRKNSPRLWDALYGLNIKSLSLSLNVWKCLSTESLPLSSLTHLQTLSMEVKYDFPGLWESLRGLNIKNLSLSLSVWYGLQTETLSQSLLTLTQLQTLTMEVEYDIPRLWESLRGLNIKRLSLGGRVKHKESLSKVLHTFTHLEKLAIVVDKDNSGLWETLHGLNIKSLNLSGGLGSLREEPLSQSLSSFTQLETLSIILGADSLLLLKVLGGLRIKCLSLSLSDELGDAGGESLSRSLSLLTRLETLCIIMQCDSSGLCEALHGLNINNLSMSGEWRGLHAESLRRSLLSLKKLETLSIEKESDCPGLWQALYDLKIKSLSLSGNRKGFIVTYKEPFSDALRSLTKLETLSMDLEYDSPCLLTVLHGLRIKSLILCGVFRGLCPKYLSQFIPSLTLLEILGFNVRKDSPKLWAAVHGKNIKSLSLDLSIWKGLHEKSLSQSLSSLTQLDMLSIKVENDIPGLWEALYLLNIKSLSLSLSMCTGLRSDSLSKSLTSLNTLETLNIEVEYDILGLWEALHGLSIKSLSLSLSIWKGVRSDSLSQSLSSLRTLETLSVAVKYDIPSLWESLRGLNIKSLSLRMWECLPSNMLSQTLASLTKLETLCFVVDKDKPGLWEAFHGLNIKSLSISLCVGYGKLRAGPLYKSLSSLTALEQLYIIVDEDNPGLWFALNGLNITCLSLSLSEEWGGVQAESLSKSLLSLTQLETLSIKMQYDSPGLWEALHGLNIKSLRLSGEWRGLVAKSMSESLLSLKQLESLSIKMQYDSPGLWKALYGLNIKSLSLSGEWRGLLAESMSESLSSLTQLETLSIDEEYDIPGLSEALNCLTVKNLIMSGKRGDFRGSHEDSLC